MRLQFMAPALIFILGWLARAAEPVAEPPAAVPPPSETPARVLVSGRTSTPVAIKIVCTGQQIPKTFSGKRVKNFPGFQWWVSQHYALKTDFEEARARFYLELLELAYPHYADLFGGEPPGMAETRMAVIYGKTQESMEKTMAADMGFKQFYGGGGVTWEGLRAAYNYPSGGLQYHLRYILLHECTHLFQMCRFGSLRSTPGWFYEGIADALSSHVYDDAAKTLTVFVCDKAAVPNWFDEGLEGFRAPGQAFEKIHKGGACSRGEGFVLMQYFLTDPDRAQRFRYWRDEMCRLDAPSPRKEQNSERLLKNLFGPWEKLNADVAAWTSARRSTFHYVDWGWEQNGNTLWSYGWPQKGPFSRTDLRLPPGQKAALAPSFLDYAAAELPPTIGPVQAGGDEPVFGCQIDFSRNPGKGRAGLGLGVVDAGKDAEQPGYLKVLVNEEKELVLDGTDLGLKKKSVPFDATLKAALNGAQHRLGLTIRIAKDTVKVTARAGPKDGLQALDAELELDAKARARLLEKPLAILARDGYHGVTPFSGEPRAAEPSPAIEAPAGRWRNPGEKRLYALYRACFRWPENPPEPLRAARDELLAAADKDAATQTKALETAEAKLPELLRAIRGSGASARIVNAAIADLLGLALTVDANGTANPDELEINAEIAGPLSGSAEGTLSFSGQTPDGEKPIEAPEKLSLDAGKRAAFRRTWRPGAVRGPFSIAVKAELNWKGERIILEAFRDAQVSIPCWWVCGPFENPGGAAADVAHPPEEKAETKPHPDKTYPGKDGKELAWRKIERDAKARVADEFVPDLAAIYGSGQNLAAYACVWLVAPNERQAFLAWAPTTAWWRG
ncbi:MAG: hypothetical protein HY291_03165 [Planctomycetes bacterium]|nr:hypothetical protein [Planctomycetota bacterium]